MKNYKLEVKWGLIVALTSMAWLFLERIVGLHDTYIALHASYTNLIAIPYFIIYYLALKDKRDKFYDGKISFKQGFKTGVIISLIYTILVPICLFVSLNYITPDYFKNAINYAIENKLMQASEAKAYFSYDNYVFISMVSAPLLGVMTSFIMSLILKSKRKQSVQS